MTANIVRLPIQCLFSRFIRIFKDHLDPALKLLQTL
jgi:hypothetical protein